MIYFPLNLYFFPFYLFLKWNLNVRSELLKSLFVIKKAENLCFVDSQYGVAATWHTKV